MSESVGRIITHNRSPFPALARFILYGKIKNSSLFSHMGFS